MPSFMSLTFLVNILHVNISSSDWSYFTQFGDKTHGTVGWFHLCSTEVRLTAILRWFDYVGLLIPSHTWQNQDTHSKTKHTTPHTTHNSRHTTKPAHTQQNTTHNTQYTTHNTQHTTHKSFIPHWSANGPPPNSFWFFSCYVDCLA